MQLYTYFRSSAAYRVRIALHLKGVPFEAVPVHLKGNGGEHRRAQYVKLNPEARVPTLKDEDTVIPQSLAQLEYLDECHPAPPLLPESPGARARVRALAYLIACDVHPLQNLSVGVQLSAQLGATETQYRAWSKHWITRGLDAYERHVCGHPATGRCSHGDAPTLADLCLIPQLYNARRFECDLDRWPTVTRIERHCLALAAFERALPERQPDAPADV